MNNKLKAKKLSKTQVGAVQTLSKSNSSTKSLTPQQWRILRSTSHSLTQTMPPSMLSKQELTTHSSCGSYSIPLTSMTIPYGQWHPPPSSHLTYSSASDQVIQLSCHKLCEALSITFGL